MRQRGVDAARLLLRGVVGGTMVAHGIRHGRTLEGTARWFSGIGFREPRLQARMSAAVEIGAGGVSLGRHRYQLPWFTSLLRRLGPPPPPPRRYFSMRWHHRSPVSRQTSA
jgi:hypothetical protein